MVGRIVTENPFFDIVSYDFLNPVKLTHLNDYFSGVVTGNMTDDESLDQFYGAPEENEIERRSSTGGETTHARKEVTPGKIHICLSIRV